MRIFLLLLAILPLWIDFSKELPYEPPKIFLFEVAVFLVWFLVLLKKVKNRSKQMMYRIVKKLNALDLMVALYFIALAIGTIFSVDPANSFFGSEDRGTGLWFYWNLVLMYFLLRLILNEKRWGFFMRASSVVVLIVSVYAIAQRFGFDFEGLHSAFQIYGRSGPTRVFSTLGHPNFLGTYLALFLPFGFYLSKKDKNIRWRVVAISASILAVVTTWLTYSRGAWIAIGASVLVLVALRKKRTARWYRKVVAVSIGMTSVVAVLLVVFQPILLSSKNSFVYRLGSTMDFTTGSNLARVAEWKYAGSLMPARIFTGYGIDTYMHFAVKRTKDPSERNRDFKKADPSIADRLHNSILDTLWSGGILALCALIGVFVAVGVRAKRSMISYPVHRARFVAILASLAAYVVSNMVSFDFSISGIWFFILLAGLAVEPDV